MTGVLYHADDPDEGYDIAFEKEGEGRNTQYGAIRLAREASSVEAKHIRFIVNNPLESILRWRTYEEIERMYKGYGDEGYSEEEPPPRRSSRRSDDDDGEYRRDDFREPAREESRRPRAQINRSDDVDDDRGAVGQDHDNVSEAQRRVNAFRERTR